jgi:hypothetical protein
MAKAVSCVICRGSGAAEFIDDYLELADHDSDAQSVLLQPAISNRHEKLGDSLVGMSKHVNFAVLADEIDTALPRPSSSVASDLIVDSTSGASRPSRSSLDTTTVSRARNLPLTVSSYQYSTAYPARSPQAVDCLWSAPLSRRVRIQKLP